MLDNLKSLVLCGALLVTSAYAQQSIVVEQAVDRAIARECALLSILHTRAPVAETYIQDLAADSDLGTVPVTDHYFLGRIDLSHGVTQTSYLPKSSEGKKPFPPLSPQGVRADDADRRWGVRSPPL